MNKKELNKEPNKESNFDRLLDEMKKDPKLFEELCQHPKEALQATGIEFTRGERAVIDLLDGSVNKGPKDLQNRMTAKGGFRGRPGGS